MCLSSTCIVLSSKASCCVSRVRKGEGIGALFLGVNVQNFIVFGNS